MYIDTNYFLRLIVDDGSGQHRQVETFFHQIAAEKSRHSSSTVVFFEIDWVLKTFYHLSKQRRIAALSKILSMRQVKFRELKTLSQALSLFKSENISLEDCYHLAYMKEKDIKDLASFDKKLQKVWNRINQ